MDDEFALCWNNFQDNIASGFQNLYDRGDLVDVTIACDGKLLHAHKIVLAICSPYFQEMFITNPCKHPIIILKDVPYTVMCELLQFMYQGVVNVKHTELSLFMKIAQTLQVKGLATSSTSQKSPSHHHHHSSHHSHHAAQAQQSTSNTTTNNNNNNNNKNGGNGNNNNNNSNNNNNNPAENSGNNIIETKINSLSSSTPYGTKSSSENLSSIAGSNTGGTGGGNNSNNGGSSSGTGVGIGSLKRCANEIFNNSIEGLSIYPRKQMKRYSIEHNNSNDHDINNDSMDNMNSSSDDVFLPPIPQISMIESRFDINSVKREILNNNNSEFIGSGSSSASGGSNSMRNTLPPPFNFEYGMYAAAAANKSIEYPNELHMSSDYPKGIGNHMDIPSGTSITMLSSTSLLHGNCIFNRNNTVATQQGMKTYWLCKSYRITMCRARCITHQGRVISATGVHNHPPHMKSSSNNDSLMINPVSNNPNNNNNMLSPQGAPNCLTPGGNSGSGGSGSGGIPSSSGLCNMRISQATSLSQHHFSGGGGGINNPQQHQQHLTSHHHHISPSQSPTPPQHQLQSPHSQLHHTSSSNMQSGHHHHNAAVFQNMMHNVLSQNNLMHLTNMAPMLNTFPPQHPSQLSNSTNMHQPSPSNLQITPILTNSPTMNSPSNRSSSHSQSQMDSPNLQSNSMVESPQSSNNTNDGNTATTPGASSANSNNMQSVVSSSSIVPVSETSPHHHHQQHHHHHHQHHHQQQQQNDDNVGAGGGSGGQGSSGGRDGMQDPNNSPQTNIISSITISPPQPSFKMEHI